MPKTSSDVFVEDIIRSFMREYSGINKQMEESEFSFKFGVTEMVEILKCNKSS